MGTQHKGPHPKDTASFLSRATLWWIFGLLKVGYGRSLEQDDLFNVRDEDQAEVVTRRLEKKWQDEKERAKLAKSRACLWKALMKFLSWKEYTSCFCTATLNLFGITLAVFSTIKMTSLFGKGMDADTVRREGLVYSYGIVFGLLVRILTLHNYYVFNSFPAIRIRAAILGLIYKKVLNLPEVFVNSGHVMELISNDSQSLVTSAEWLLPDLFRHVVESLIMYGLLIHFAGWPAVVSSFVFVIIGFLRTLFVNLEYKLRKGASRLADQRLGYLKQILSNIQSIKLNTWEQLLEGKIRNVRREELIRRTKIMSVIGTFNFTYFISNGMAVFLFIMFLISSERPLTTEMMFALLACFDVLNINLCWVIPMSITLCAKVASSLKRIESFLEIVEQCSDDGTSPTEFAKSVNDPKNKPLLNLCNVSCQLPVVPETDTERIRLLSDVNLNATDPGLIVIIGDVGSGKSSLLSCILGGELCLASGIVKHSGKLAYVAQTPWVFPGTIRENILFGSVYNEGFYWEIIEACELKMDLKMFPDGDLSLIGEQGSTVSGGQRTRVALARALYSQADIYLLDDPFSTLDAKVADNIFHRCIRGFLAERIVILTTHHSRYVKEADYFVQLQDGVVIAQGCVSSMVAELDALTVGGKHGVTSFQRYSEPVLHHLMHEPTGTVLRQEEENRETGNVKLMTYWKYLTIGLPGVVLLIIAILFCFGQGLVVMLNITAVGFHGMTKIHGDVTRYLLILALACLVLGVATASFYFLFLRSSWIIHNKMVNCVLKASLLFYAVNPVGRIINRFSQDINNFDDFLPVYSLALLMIILQTLSSVIFFSINNLLFGPLSVVLLIGLFIVARFFCRVVVDIKRLMLIACSPLYSHFANTMDGIKSIRVYRRKRKFMDALYSHIDAHNETLFAYYPAVRWFGITVDLICLTFLAIILLTITFTVTENSNSVLLGVSVLFAFRLVDSVQYGIRMFVETNSTMTSAERALAYTNIESEKGHDVPSVSLTEGWPTRGKICFTDVSMSYYEGGPKALRDITFQIDPSEKVGIIGRTGAGKSSLLAALMRLNEFAGKIFIDDVNINELNIRQLRRPISVISQKQMLLCGRLRESLDPFDEFTDLEIWEALDHMQMQSVVSRLPDQLDSIIVDSGSNFSVGERQLLHLARVLLQKNKIIIFDEATANVDLKTEGVIQRIIHEEFKDCTVITIAHRLNTILDCDRVMLLDDGKIVEFDDPNVLLQKEDSSFRKMIEISK